MNLYTEYKLKRGSVLIAIENYLGEEDFNHMHEIMIELISPDDAGYSVDSMCIGGYLRKDDILLKTSSESPYDCCCIVYNVDSLSENQLNLVKDWIDSIVDLLNQRYPKN